jgi:hypothetical protein
MKPLAAGSLMRAGWGWRADWTSPNTDGLELNDEREAAWRAMQDSVAEDAMPGSTTALPPEEERDPEDGWCANCDDPNCYRSAGARLDWRNRLLWVTRGSALATAGQVDWSTARLPSRRPGGVDWEV